MQVVLYISLLVVVYTYILYPVILFFLSTTSKKTFIVSPIPQSITVIIPAFNEVHLIQQKIENTLAITNGVTTQIVLVSTGSTDGTQHYTHPNITHISGPERLGKPSAINQALLIATGQIVLLTDANTILNVGAIQAVLPLFANATTGAVSGEKTFNQINKALLAENIYWSLEAKLKQLEANYNTVVGAAGELFVVRRKLLQPLPANVILDDFYIAMQVIQQGYTINYTPLAIATEAPSLHLYDEYNRRVRIASGAMQWLCNYGLVSFFKYPIRVQWQLFSHRICRWVVAPIALLIFTIFCMLIQPYIYIPIIYFCLAAVGYILQQFNKPTKLFYFPFYFLFIHICMGIGFVKYSVGKHTILWKKANR